MYIKQWNEGLEGTCSFLKVQGQTRHPEKHDKWRHPCVNSSKLTTQLMWPCQYTKAIPAENRLYTNFSAALEILPWCHKNQTLDHGKYIAFFCCKYCKLNDSFIRFAFSLKLISNFVNRFFGETGFYMHSRCTARELFNSCSDSGNVYRHPDFTCKC